MKKKHLKNLDSLEKWLEKDCQVAHLKASFDAIRRVLRALPDEAPPVNDLPPPPAEISHEPTTIALYSDGGCRGNPGPGAFAYLVQSHSGEILAEGVEYEGHTTNNKMELMGPIKGLSHLLELLPQNGKDPLLSKVMVLTDSKYVVDGMKSWTSGWKARGWKKADGKAPENLELWQSLDRLKDSFMQIEWRWVKGHAGHPQNEYCDRRANEMMDSRLA